MMYVVQWVWEVSDTIKVFVFKYVIMMLTHFCGAPI